MMIEEMDLLIGILPLLIPVALVQFALMIAGIISVVRKEVPHNRGSEKILWLLLVILVNIIGPVIYFAVGSKRLDELSQNRDGGGHF
jgi:hypothetical protein